MSPFQRLWRDERRGQLVIQRRGGGPPAQAEPDDQEN
jgi:hypothetical protein